MNPGDDDRRFLAALRARGDFPRLIAEAESRIRQLERAIAFLRSLERISQLEAADDPF